MNELAIVTYLVALFYVATLFMLSAVAARQAGPPVWLLKRAQGAQRLTGAALLVIFAVAFVWPAVRLWTGGLGPDDPATQALQGWPAALTGHALVAIGAAVALVSQYHMGACWRVGAIAGELGPLIDAGPFALSRNPVFIGQGASLSAWSSRTRI